MSHHSYFRLRLVTAENINLDEIPYPVITKTVRSVGGMTRSDWFKTVCGKVLSIMQDVKNIEFLAEKCFDYQKVEPDNTDLIGQFRPATREDWDNEEWYTQDNEYGTVSGYTIIHGDKIDQVIVSIKQLFDFSISHLNDEPLEGFVVSNEAEVLGHIHFHEYLNDAYHGEEGNSIEFYLCALHSMLELLEQAKSDNLIAVYVNEQYAPIVKI